MPPLTSLAPTAERIRSACAPGRGTLLVVVEREDRSRYTPFVVRRVLRGAFRSIVARCRFASAAGVD